MNMSQRVVVDVLDLKSHDLDRPRPRLELDVDGWVSRQPLEGLNESGRLSSGIWIKFGCDLEVRRSDGESYSGQRAHLGKFDLNHGRVAAFSPNQCLRIAIK